MEGAAEGTKDDLEELCKKLNGRKILIKGNHDRLGDEWYHCAFENVETEMHIDELNLRLIHAKEEAKDLHPDERIIYGHDTGSCPSSRQPPATRSASVRSGTVEGDYARRGDSSDGCGAGLNQAKKGWLKWERQMGIGNTWADMTGRIFLSISRVLLTGATGASWMAAIGRGFSDRSRSSRSTEIGASWMEQTGLT